MIVEPHPCISSAHEAKRQSLLYSLSCSKFFFINRYRFQNRYSMKVFPFIYQKYYIFSFNLLHYHSASHRSSFHSPPPPPACSASPPPGATTTIYPPSLLPSSLSPINSTNSTIKTQNSNLLLTHLRSTLLQLTPSPPARPSVIS